MSFSKPKVPDTAAEMRQQEEERAARVRQGSADVNQIFDERFGPQYYSGLGDAFRDYYKPQIADQFRDAQRATTIKYADRAGSSSANRRMGDLFRDKLRAETDVEMGAADAVNRAKQDVEGKRSNLIGMVEAGGSLENTAAMARAAASTNIGQQPYSPMGDLFSRYTRTLSAAANAADQGNYVNPVFQRQVDFMRGKPSGSQRVIGGG